MALAFVAVTALAVVLLALALSVPRALTGAVSGARRSFHLFSRHAAGVAGVLALTTFGHYSMYAFLPLYATGHGHGGIVVGFFATYSVWMIVGRALFGALSDRLGRVRVALLAILATAAGYLSLAASPSPPSLIAAALLLASGSAVLFPTLTALVLDRTPEAERGLALGSVRSAWDLGAMVGSAAMGFVADHLSFAAGFALASATAALGAVTLVVLERGASPSPPTP